MNFKKWCYGFMAIAMLGLFSCKGGKKLKLNVFSVDQDIQLGKQVSQQIESDKKQFPILPERGNTEIYRYVRKITGKILNSGKVKYKSRFAWQVKIIDDPKTLNAFATPGGYIYVYTGLIKYLDSEDHLAGVMGHEIAHADLRHSTRQMTKVYGIDLLLSALTGKESAIKQVATGLLSLKFGRNHETESDEHSVIYLCPTSYKADGAAGFFKKLQSQGGGRPPQFLSTHPNPGNRVANITKKRQELKCRGTQTYRREYAKVKNSIK